MTCEIDTGNLHNKNAVSVKKSGCIVGHVPRENTKVFKYFIKRGRSIEAQVKGDKVNHGLGYGLEIPVVYIFKGQSKDTAVLVKLLKI